MPKPSHYRGDYEARAKRVRDTAKADPLTQCWRCGLMLHQHKPHKSGKPATWTAGHLIDSNPRSPLAPEASTCNKSAGATYGNRLRGARRAAQKAVRRTPRHTPTRW